MSPPASGRLIGERLSYGGFTFWETGDGPVSLAGVTRPAAGMVRVVASDRRSQSQNREAAAERLAKLVRQALVVPRKRRATRPTKASREQRLAEKKKRGERKRDRRRDFND